MGRGILEVHLVDAKGLADTDFLVAGKIDPYVLIQYRSQECKSSVARGQGRNPSWNETFKFQVNSQGSNIQHKLTLRVMDHDTFSRDDFIGEATINVTDLIAIGMEKGSIEQHPTKYNVVLADRSYCGEIRVGINFKAKMQEEGEEELGGWKHSFRA
ncbi:elicitor-responsive protein 1 isoform X1 [Ananas comosus]|uniref:Elicitor-responsive protein 1 isoform X1 n=1 Tax=Ananas comosus TaxID=4615 RepID=A0A6P5G2U4_ANACO|nr:elicitor-responsive protein 1 isoform X1 [Ananas comosus]